MYWERIRRKIGETRWAWMELAQADHSPHKVDFQLVKIALQQDLKVLQAGDNPLAGPKKGVY